MTRIKIRLGTVVLLYAFAIVVTYIFYLQQGLILRT